MILSHCEQSEAISINKNPSLFFGSLFDPAKNGRDVPYGASLLGLQEDKETRTMSRAKRKTWVDEMFLTDFYVLAYRDRVDDPEQVKQDVEGVVRMLCLPKGSEILDWCCGYFRHAIPLARKGYKVTGLDLSPTHIAIGKMEAKKAGLGLKEVFGSLRYLLTGKFEGMGMHDLVGLLGKDQVRARMASLV